MGKYYDNSIIPKHLRRNFDVYERINKLGIDLGKERDWLTDLKCIQSLHIVNEAGHCPHDEVPEKVNPIILKILQEAI